MEEKFLFYFEAEINYDDEVESKGGFVMAKSFEEAAAKMEQYYGEDLVEITKLKAYDVGIFEGSVQTMQSIKNLLLEDKGIF